MADVAELERALKNPNVRKMLDVIASAEGADYNTLFGGSKFDSYSAHPNVRANFTETTGNKNVTTAAGRYQFLNSTWGKVAKKYGLKDFSPKNQDLAAIALIKGRGALGDVMRGDLNKAVGKLGGEWASLPSSTAPQPKKSWSDIEKMVGASRTPNRQSSKLEIDALLKAYDKSKAKTTEVQQPKINKLSENDLLKAFDAKQAEMPQTSGLPDFDAQGVIQQNQPIEPTQPKPELSLGQKIVGAGEAALSAGTGAVGGILGTAGGALLGTGREIASGEFGSPEAAQRIAQTASQGAQALTYEPQTQGGQRIMQGVGQIAEDTGLTSLPPTLGGGLGTTAATLGRASIPTATVAARDVAQAAKPAISQAVDAAKSGASKIGAIIPKGSKDNPLSHMGAAQVPTADIRKQLFDEFDVPATAAQVSRDQTDLAEMYNTARKGGESGKIIQDRLDEQQAKLASAIDDIIESKGAKAIDSQSVGADIRDVLNTQYKVERAQQNKAYEAVKNSESAKSKVDIDAKPNWSKEHIENEAAEGRTPDNERSLLDVINEESYLGTSDVYSKAKDMAVKLKIAQLDADGNLVAMPKENRPTINQVEEFRKRISQLGDSTKSGDGTAVQTIKKLVDNALDNSGSNAYKKARKDYADFKSTWANKAIIKDLISKKSRANSGDQKIIDEKIIDRIISPNTSKEDLEFIETLINKTEAGRSAWNDLQASIINRIRNEAYSGAQDSQGNNTLIFNKMDKIISKLDGDTRRLDTLLGHEQAQKMRDANELARIIQTVPPNTGVNWSNTFTALAAAIDGIVFGMTGIPATAATALRFAMKYIKDKKDVARAHNIVRKLETSETKEGKF